MRGKKTEVRVDLHTAGELRALAKKETVRRTAARMGEKPTRSRA